MSESAGKAVFLSYASQDAEAARRIAEALRAGGVEVWLDQEGGLVGGDVWDRKIREQINNCALFVPLISANTQARKEGYFRLEWHLAEERVRLIAKGVPFLVPVCVDGTIERGALVPDAFLAVQWTRLRQAYGGQTRPGSVDSERQAPDEAAVAAFVARVKKLLGSEAAPTGSAVGAPLEDARGRGPAAHLPDSPPAPSPNSELAVEEFAPPAAVRLPPEGAFETFERRLPLRWRALPVVVALVVGALLATAVAWYRWARPGPAPLSRFTHRLPEGQVFRTSSRAILAVSPDGRRFAYNIGAGIQLRSLDELEARSIPGTETGGANPFLNPFFSPDGNWIGFSQSGQLKRVAISGGSPVFICAVPSTVIGASWEADGTILFGQPNGIMRVPATGGTPTVVIPAQNGALLLSPRMLPDGDTVLFHEKLPSSTSVDTRIVAQKISTGARKVLVEAGLDARYLPTGHLVYVVGNVLMGVAFDARGLTTVGGAVPVVQNVMRATTIIRSGATYSSAANYGVAADGTLIWIHSTAAVGTEAWQIGVSDRAGKLTRLALPPGPYDTPRASPDGTRVAVSVADAKETYVAIYDLDGKTSLRRLTFGGNSRYPVWSRDGQRVTFQSDREGDLAIFWQRADGSAPAERLTKPEKDTAHVPASWSPKDETLLFTVIPANQSEAPGALWSYTRSSGTSAAFASVKDVAQDPVFSPDGRWVAYGILEAGAQIQPFPATGAQYQLPRREGDNPATHPFWSPDGTMLFFAPGPGRLAAVTVTTQPAVAFGNQTPIPRPFSIGSTRLPRGYDVMPDGRLIGRLAPGTGAESGEPQEIRIVLNWTEELKRLVPVK